MPWSALEMNIILDNKAGDDLQRKCLIVQSCLRHCKWWQALKKTGEVMVRMQYAWAARVNYDSA